jgi:hypothetical protein
MKARRLTWLAGILIAVGLVTGTAATAHADAPVASDTPNSLAAAASVTNVCGNGGFGYCMNDWNGTSNTVKMYYGGNSNENFGVIFLSDMCNHGVSTDTCPISVPGYHFGGAAIEAFKYIANGSCVGTDANALMVLTACPDSFGNGGGNGTIMLRFVNSSCQASNQLFSMNRYWTNKDQTGTGVWAQSGGAIGAQGFFDARNVTHTCWGIVNG